MMQEDVNEEDLKAAKNCVSFLYKIKGEKPKKEYRVLNFAEQPVGEILPWEIDPNAKPETFKQRIKKAMMFVKNFGKGFKNQKAERTKRVDRARKLAKLLEQEAEKDLKYLKLLEK
jgi:hypothetical protein